MLFLPAFGCLNAYQSHRGDDPSMTLRLDYLRNMLFNIPHYISVFGLQVKPIAPIIFNQTYDGNGIYFLGLIISLTVESVIYHLIYFWNGVVQRSFTRSTTSLTYTLVNMLSFSKSFVQFQNEIGGHIFKSYCFAVN